MKTKEKYINGYNEYNEAFRLNFKIDIPVRISDINYGGHLGHAELIKITHQARLKFFAEFSLKEDDIDGVGIIVKSLLVNYEGEGFFDDVLHIDVSILNRTKISCEFCYVITKNENLPVATVFEKILFMDYKTRRLKKVPSIMSVLQNRVL